MVVDDPVEVHAEIEQCPPWIGIVFGDFQSDWSDPPLLTRRMAARSSATLCFRFFLPETCGKKSSIVKARAPLARLQLAMTWQICAPIHQGSGSGFRALPATHR